MSYTSDFMRAQVAQFLFNTPEMLPYLKEHLKLLHKGGYSKPLIECVYQFHEEFNKPDIHDFYIFLLIHSYLQDHTLAAFHIPISVQPAPDSEVMKNNSALVDNLPEPFVGSFVGGKSSLELCVSDGYIFWKTPIHVPVITRKEIGIGFEVRWVIISKGRVPLEVGTNTAEKFLYYVTHQSGCARWPFGHSQLTVFVNLRCFEATGCADEGFEAKLIASGENVGVVSKSNRSPWEYWLKDVPQEYLDLPPLRESSI